MGTVVVLDLAHCGTTMTAGVLEVLGVSMVGERYKPGKWEDQEVIEALWDEKTFADLVSKRSGLWGFKYPGAWEFAPLLTRYLKGLVCIAIYKDPISVTMRRFGAISAHKIRNTIRQMNASVDGIINSGLAVEWFSYQKAVTEPRAFIKRLARLSGVNATKTQMSVAERFIRPGIGYPE